MKVSPGIELCTDRTIRKQRTKAGEASQRRHLQRVPANMINGLFNVSIHPSETRQDIEGLGCESQY